MRHCLQARNCFLKFHQSQFDEARNEWLDDKHVPTISVSSEPKGRLLEAKWQRDVANEKSRIGSIFSMVYFRNNSFKL